MPFYTIIQQKYFIIVSSIETRELYTYLMFIFMDIGYYIKMFPYSVYGIKIKYFYSTIWANIATRN